MNDLKTMCQRHLLVAPNLFDYGGTNTHCDLYLGVVVLPITVHSVVVVVVVYKLVKLFFFPRNCTV